MLESVIDCHSLVPNKKTKELHSCRRTLNTCMCIRTILTGKMLSLTVLISLVPKIPIDALCDKNVFLAAVATAKERRLAATNSVMVEFVQAVNTCFLFASDRQ